MVEKEGKKKSPRFTIIFALSFVFLFHHHKKLYALSIIYISLFSFSSSQNFCRILLPPKFPKRNHKKKSHENFPLHSPHFFIQIPSFFLSIFLFRKKKNKNAILQLKGTLLLGNLISTTHDLQQQPLYLTRTNFSC